MVICLKRGADLHMVYLMPLPLTVCCFGKIQIGFTFLAPAHPGSPGQRGVKHLCVCVCVRACVRVFLNPDNSTPVLCFFTTLNLLSTCNVGTSAAIRHRKSFHNPFVFSHFQHLLDHCLLCYEQGSCRHQTLPMVLPLVLEVCFLRFTNRMMYRLVDTD